MSPFTAIKCKIPFELWFKKPTSYESLRIFGFMAYAHKIQGKLPPRALKVSSLDILMV